MIGALLRRMYRRRFSEARGRSLIDPPGLLTPRVPLGAAALIRDAEGRVLLIRQTYQRAEQWLPPGGWVDRGESPRQAACREVREELGVRVAVGPPLSTRGGGYGELTIMYDCRLLDDADFRLSDEIQQAKFFSPDALPPMADVTRESLIEALAALDGGSWPRPSTNTGSDRTIST